MSETHYRNIEPKCPHCDNEIVISEHDLYELHSEETHEISCPYCEKNFYVVSIASWSFNTSEEYIY